MLSSLFFLIVNSTLLLMLIGFLKEKGNIDLMFLTCLAFTFLGNVTLGISSNTIISFINVILGFRLYSSQFI